jgi:hypothetical protein
MRGEQHIYEERMFEKTTTNTNEQQKQLKLSGCEGVPVTP